MTKLETLYNSIRGLKELGLPLNEETLRAVDEMEEELIKNEIIPRLSSARDIRWMACSDSFRYNYQTTTVGENIQTIKSWVKD